MNHDFDHNFIPIIDNEYTNISICIRRRSFEIGINIVTNVLSAEK